MRFTLIAVAAFALLAFIAIAFGPIMALTALALVGVMFWLDLPRRLWPFVGMLAALLMIGARSAMASPLGDMMTAITPGLIEIIGVLLTGIVAWVAAKAREKWGIDIEARHREALHWALFSGAQLAMANELTGKAALELVLHYVNQSVPDAIASLNPAPDVIVDLAKAKLEQAAAEKARDLTGGAVDKLTEALKRAGV